ncbi:hypothetical protein WJX73_000118 [Symbiochloris irregularis]|uniref:Kinesin motor domain-containing protein n=1 Tax=Symbiochloris irregularis TaxID=706552 RepID=A0AAW1P6I7_9CHLO
MSTAMQRRGAGGQDNSGQQVNVQVILRCRPCNKEELYTRAPQVVTCNEAAHEATLFQNIGGKSLGRSFHFDKVFGPNAGQQKLYDQAIAPIVEEVLDGFNCTIFAYGQTGTGKTYTMEGGDRNSDTGKDLSEVAGVIPRAISQIFAKLDTDDSEYTVKCSFLELYNEETTDLLAVGDAVKTAMQKLRILEDKNGVVVQGLEEIIVKSSADIYALLDRGSAKRKTAETLLNKQSSRSHSVFCITVHIREVSADGEEVIKIGKLNLVDLAGSENVSRSGAVDVRAKEAGLINKSLLTLGRVITALVEALGHIPYRDSKLTRLLRDSLGGRTKTCIIATIAPTVQCQEETLSTLDYAHRAKNIRNRPEVNQKISKTAHIKELNAEMDKLKAELHATREKNGVYLPADQFESRETNSKMLQSQVEALEAEREASAEAARQAQAQLQAQLHTTQLELGSTRELLEAARVGLQERDFLVLAHERSEDALATHALDLTGKLEASCGDAVRLAGRLEEMMSREAGNAAIVARLGGESSQALTQLELSVQEAMMTQHQGHQSLTALLQQLKGSKDAAVAELQGHMQAVQQQLEAVSATVEATTEATLGTGVSGLQQIKDLHATFIAAASQAAAEANMQLEAAYSSLEQSFQSQQSQFADLVQEQQSSSAALLRAAQDTVALTQRELKEGFAQRMSNGQVSLLNQIGGLIRTFAEEETREVAAAVAGAREQLSTGSAHVSAGFEGLHTHATSLASALQGHEAQMTAAAQEASETCVGRAAAVQGCHETSTTCGAGLRVGVQAAASTAAQSLEAHRAAVQAELAQAQAQLLSAAHSGKQQTGDALAIAVVGHKRVAESLPVQHAQETNAIHGVAAAAATGNAALQDFGKRARLDLGGLREQVHLRTADDFKQDPHQGRWPESKGVEPVPASWVQDMRAPPQETLLAQFRQQALAAADPASAAAQAAIAVAAGERLAAVEEGDGPEAMDCGGGSPVSVQGNTENDNPNWAAAKPNGAVIIGVVVTLRSYAQGSSVPPLAVQLVDRRPAPQNCSSGALLVYSAPRQVKSLGGSGKAASLISWAELLKGSSLLPLGVKLTSEDDAQDLTGWQARLKAALEARIAERGCCILICLDDVRSADILACMPRVQGCTYLVSSQHQGLVDHLHATDLQFSSDDNQVCVGQVLQAIIGDVPEACKGLFADICRVWAGCMLVVRVIGRALGHKRTARTLGGWQGCMIGLKASIQTEDGHRGSRDHALTVLKARTDQLAHPDKGVQAVPQWYLPGRTGPSLNWADVAQEAQKWAAQVQAASAEDTDDDLQDLAPRRQKFQDSEASLLGQSGRLPLAVLGHKAQMTAAAQESSETCAGRAAAVQGCHETSTTCGAGLRVGVQAAASTAAQSLEAHRAAVQAQLAQAQAQLLSAAHSGKQQTGDVVGHKRMAEGLPVQHAQETTDLQGVATAAAIGDAALQDFGKRARLDLGGLREQVHLHTGDESSRTPTKVAGRSPRAWSRCQRPGCRT